MGYGDPEREYWQLMNGVSQWDVAGQRQVQITGRDAERLVQILVPRDLSHFVASQGIYVALCNHAGTIINDPILLKLDQDRYWLSIADSNIVLWSRAIAAERGLNVEILEPDVSPMAVQGPKAEDVIASIFGEWVREIKSFWFREAGQPWDIGPGCPNARERIESGLLSWGGDTDDAANPFEVRLSKYVDLDVPDEVIGIEALRRIHSQGLARHQLGVILEGEVPTQPHAVWYDILADSRKVGNMTNGVWSRRLRRNIGFALISRKFSPGDAVEVLKDGKRIPAVLTELPFC